MYTYIHMLYPQWSVTWTHKGKTNDTKALSRDSGIAARQN